MPSTIASPRQLLTYVTVVAIVLLARPEPATFTVGCSIAALGIAIRVWGCGHLRKNKDVISSGPFARVQHPLYLGTLLISVGAIIAAGSPDTPALLIWTAIGPVFLAAFFAYYLPKKRRIEGGRLERRFGERFREWQRQVPAMVPSLKPYSRADARRWEWSVYRRNHELEMDALVVVLFCAMFFLHRGG